jgi:hypothetical protein
VVQFDVEAALRRHLAIPQTRDRRYNIKLCQYRGSNSLFLTHNKSIMSVLAGKQPEELEAK